MNTATQYKAHRHESHTHMQTQYEIYIDSTLQGFPLTAMFTSTRHTYSIFSTARQWWLGLNHMPCQLLSATYSTPSEQ